VLFWNNYSQKKSASTFLEKLLTDKICKCFFGKTTHRKNLQVVFWKNYSQIKFASAFLEKLLTDKICRYFFGKTTHKQKNDANGSETSSIHII
jgi:hypothetical protein